MHLAEKLIRENLRTKKPRLDLGNCGLDGTEPFLELLAEATHLKALNFSIEWKKGELSNNRLKINYLKKIPNRLPPNLKLMVLSGYKRGKGKITDISALSYLVKLKNLDISNNQITDISPLIGLIELERLKISDNRITDISALTNLTNLSSLELGYYRTKTLFGRLEIDLNSLMPNENKDFDLEYFVNSFDFEEYNNTSSKNDYNVPTEFLGNGHLFKREVQKLQDYLRSIQNQDYQKQLNEAKLIMVGIGEVGKTELVEALSEPAYEYVKGRQSTAGIRIKIWKPVCRRAGEAVPDFRINVWDFAGQEINYGTHQYFLTKSSLYVFVWETRKDNENTGFEYWLNVVSLLSDNAPILVVQNKTDIYESEINQRDWKDRFPNIVGFYKTSCKAGIGIAELSAVIRDEITKLKHTHEIWNKDRYAIREALEQDTRNHIPQSAYFDMCEGKGLTRLQSLYLSDQLHKIGVVLHFQDDFELENTVVLKPEWATKASYLLLDNKRNTQSGYFRKTDLKTIWQEREFDDKHEFLLNLMLKFELVFNLQNTPQYIVPELLPVEEKQESENLATDFDLTFEYHYDFMPKSILSRFTCRNATYIAGEHFWKYGVWLQEDGTLAKLESNDVSKYIRVRLVGKRAEQLLYLVRRDIGLIHQDLRNPPVREVVPCPCAVCKKAKQQDKHFYEFKTLLLFKEEGDKFIRCNKSAEKQAIDSLLKGIKTTPQADIDRLTLLVETLQLPEFFKAVKDLDVENAQLHKLKAEFIGGQSEKDSNYIQRLRVWVGSL